MLFHQYLRMRKSIRNYKNKSLSAKSLETLKNHIAKTNEQYEEKNWKVCFFEDGKYVFQLLDGEGGYQGKMIEGPHYIGVCMQEENPEDIMAAAYILSSYEKLVFDMNLGSCWVNVLGLSASKKEELLGAKKQDIHFLLVIGESDEDRIGTPKETASRLSVEEIVFLNDLDRNMTLSEMTTWGLEELFYNVRNVPTNMNRQPWRFVVDNDVIKMYVIGKADLENLTDAGIMMFNFEEMAHDLGIRGEWKQIGCEEVEHKGTKYYCVGIFDM